MASVVDQLDDLARKAEAGTAFTREDADRLAACRDLVAVGTLGEAGRRRASGDVVTFGRVCTIAGGVVPDTCGEAGEVRVTGSPASLDEAAAWVRAAVALAGMVPVTALSLPDLWERAGQSAAGLAAAAARLHGEGLTGIAEAPVDGLPAADLEKAVRAAREGGLEVRRLTVARASGRNRLECIERAADLQRRLGSFSAFAPLPRQDSTTEPSTGYDDVRTIATARLMCPAIPAIQVDWPLYGPKLAQVALLYGANDIDGVAAIDDLTLGPRRAPREDVSRQIRAAVAVPVERDGRYEPRP
jgi:hypothetical protein